MPMFERSGSETEVAGSGAEQSSRALVTASVETCLCCRTGIFAPPATVSECAESKESTTLDWLGPCLCIKSGCTQVDGLMPHDRYRVNAATRLAAVTRVDDA
ncbi:MAG: hypothetical protein WCD11_01440 [Solirubrobacteraceae bacterium]